MTLPYGTEVVSKRDPKRRGTIVGWGTLQWPQGSTMSGDGGVPQAVYLVQVEEGSNSLTGPVCLVFRADQVMLTPPSAHTCEYDIAVWPEHGALCAKPSTHVCLVEDIGNDGPQSKTERRCIEHVQALDVIEAWTEEKWRTKD